MRPLLFQALWSAMFACGAIVGCQQAVPPEVETPDAASMTGRQAAFSADRAWEQLRALTQNGPRVIDTPGHEKAQNYIQEQLEKLNLEVEIDEFDLFTPPTSGLEKFGEGGAELAGTEDGDDESETDAPSLFIRSIRATIPGRLRSGSILLIAPYDTQPFDDFDFIGANDGGSGAAVLLELGRVISADPLPYATELIFVDGHAPFAVPNSDGDWRAGLGFVRLAFVKQAQGVSDVHLVVYLNQIGDADLHIVRDLLSHRIYREEFFEAAERLGQTAAFGKEAPFESSGLKHRALSAIGLRRIVSIVDTAFGGDEPPGLYAGTEQDTMDQCSPESLDAVGRVVLEGLEAISKWLIKIERFSLLPLEASPEPEPEAEPGSAEQAADETQH